MDKDLVKRLYKELNNYSAVARALNISRQRIHQIVTNYHNSGKQGREYKYKYHFKKEVCEICKLRSAVVLHHKDFNNENDEIDNLTPLCLKCHGAVHKGRPHNKTAQDRAYLLPEIKRAVTSEVPKTVIAEELGISKSTLYKILYKHNLID